MQPPLSVSQFGRKQPKNFNLTCSRTQPAELTDKSSTNIIQPSGYGCWPQLARAQPMTSDSQRLWILTLSEKLEKVEHQVYQNAGQKKPLVQSLVNQPPLTTRGKHTLQLFFFIYCYENCDIQKLFSLGNLFFQQ